MKRVNLVLPVSLISAGVTGFLLWFILARLADELSLALQVVIFVATGAAVVLAIAGAYFGVGILNQRHLQAKEETKHKRLQTDEHQIRIVAQSRTFHGFEAGHQVYQWDALNHTTTPLHLTASQVNGIRHEPTEQELEAWKIHKLAFGRGPVAIAAPEPAQLESGPPPLLPVLVEAQRLIIAGGSDAGKSTLTKHLIAARSDHSKIVVIDPHAPSKVLGFDVIGAGRKWARIGQALESLELLMQDRYDDVAAGLMGYFGHERISIFVDEWTSIVKEVKGAGPILGSLLVESRKVNMHLTLLAHSTTVEALGLPDAQIRKSAVIVQLTGGNIGAPRRAFILPDTPTTPEGKKSRPVEYSLPGPFTGFVQPAGEVVLELPSPEIIRVQKMADEGASLRAMAREFFGVDNPNGGHINQIKGLLVRAEAARKARQGRA